MHDWILVGMQFDWAEGEAELRLLDESSVHRAIIFKRLREVSVDRREHWGPSNSINDAFWTGTDGEDGIALKIEMQSGGIIRISAASCEVDGMHHSSLLIGT